MSCPYFRVSLPPAWLVMSSTIIIGISAALLLGWENMASVVAESLPALLSFVRLVPLACAAELSEIWRSIFRMPTDLATGIRFAIAYIAMATLPYLTWVICVAGTMMTETRQGQSQTKLHVRK